MQGLTAVQSASAYSFGGGVAATLYVTPTGGVQGVQILIADSANVQGYLEAARLVMGNYWQADYSAT